MKAWHSNELSAKKIFGVKLKSGSEDVNTFRPTI